MNTFYGEYSARVWTGATRTAERLGIALVSYADSSVDDPDPAVRGRGELFGLADPRALDGIILVSPAIADGASKSRLARFLAAFSALPLVYVGVDGEGLMRVVAENRSGMRELVDHLIERHGRSRIAFIKGPEGVSDADERYAAYCASLEAHGLPLRPSLVLPGTFRREAGAAAAGRLLDAGERFDAIVGANDYMALYAMKELQRRGIRVPGDVAVAGFDDFLAARSSVPALSTVRQPAEELGSEAIRMVVSAIGGSAPPAMRRAFPTRFVPRRSCGCYSPGASDHGTPRSWAPFIDDEHYEILAGTLETDSEAKFRSLFEEAVVAAYDRGTPVSAWQDLAPGLASRLPVDDRLEAERSILGLLSVLQDEIASRTLLARMEEESVFDELSGRILGAFDTSTIREAMEGEFSRRGAFCCISLFADDHRAEVFFCTDKALEGSSFPPSLLVPGGLGSLPLRADLIVLPLAYRDEVLGFFVCVARDRQPSFFEVLREHLGGALQGLRLLARISEHSATLERMVEERTSELALALERLRASNEKLERLSSVDELTGLYNRRGFFDLAGKQIEVAKRHDSDLLLLYFDLDSLKLINDVYGHAEGDEAIKAMARALSKSFRKTDIVARLGGDEFTALAIDGTIGDCDLILKRTRAFLAESNADSGKPYGLSFSVGVASSKGEPKGALDGLLAEADARLYEAKRQASESRRTAGEAAVRRRSEGAEAYRDRDGHEGEADEDGDGLEGQSPP